MSSFGDRLRELRGGLSQAEFGAVGGVRRNAQAHYEAEERSPDARYLAALAQAGIDVLYLLTGREGRAVSAPAPALGMADRPRAFDEAQGDDAALLNNFRKLDKADRAVVFKLIASLAAKGR